MDILKNKCFKFENFLDVDKSVNTCGYCVIYKQICKLTENLRLSHLIEINTRLGYNHIEIRIYDIFR